jgi:hypothetical protein
VLQDAPSSGQSGLQRVARFLPFLRAHFMFRHDAATAMQCQRYRDVMCVHRGDLPLFMIVDIA